MLINRARDRGRQKRGGGAQRLDLDHIEIESADLVKLRFFAGLTQRQAAAALGLPRRTADRPWAYARAWLFARLGGEK